MNYNKTHIEINESDCSHMRQNIEGLKRAIRAGAVDACLDWLENIEEILYGEASDYEAKEWDLDNPIPFSEP